MDFHTAFRLLKKGSLFSSVLIIDVTIKFLCQTFFPLAIFVAQIAEMPIENVAHITKNIFEPFRSQIS